MELDLARDLWQVVEVRVASEEREMVLDDEGGDPEVVRGDRGALSAQLMEEPSVVMCGLFIGEQYVDAGAVEEADEVRFVLSGPSAPDKPRPKLTEDHERHEDLVGAPEAIHDLWEALREVDVPVRVDRDSHRQSDSSTRSWAWIASSKPETSIHVPARASRSV